MKHTRVIEAAYRLKACLDIDDEDAWDVAKDELIDVYETDIPLKLVEYDDLYADLVALTFSLKYFMRKKDVLTLGGRMMEIVERYRHYPIENLTEDQKRNLDDVLLRAETDVRSFMRSVAFPKKIEKVRDAECRCMLCKRNNADFTGSHMVPNLLLQRFFTFGGKQKRDREAVEVNCLSDDKHEHYFGHEVGGHVEDYMHRTITDEEVEEENNKSNPMTYNHYFCTDCEKRFGTIETLYADILVENVKRYDPHIPYLFWMSVIWRASISKMGMCMLPHDEEKLRKILDKCLHKEASKLMLITSKLGHCAYQLFEAKDTKDETLAVVGFHNPGFKPYRLMIGRQVLNWFMSKEKTKMFVRDFNEDAESYNTGDKPEVVVPMDFLMFWIQKRSLLDENYTYEGEMQKLGGSGVRDFNALKSRQDETILKDIPYSAEGTLPLNAIDKSFAPVPRSVMKILEWKNQNPNGSIEEMSEATGYTLEEMTYMLDYMEKTKEGLRLSYKNWTHWAHR